jgi:predicted nucleic acid-binding protein
MAAEGERFWPSYRSIAEDVRVSGNAVPDVQIAALMTEHGVDSIWTRDRNFRKFDRITARDPFADRYRSGFSHGV